MVSFSDQVLHYSLWRVYCVRTLLLFPPLFYVFLQRTWRYWTRTRYTQRKWTGWTGAGKKDFTAVLTAAPSVLYTYMMNNSHSTYLQRVYLTVKMHFFLYTRAFRVAMEYKVHSLDDGVRRDNNA